MNKKIKIALLGFGTVGTGVYKLINKQKESFCHKVGAEIEISKILVRNKNKERPELLHKELLTDDWQEIIQDEEIEIIVEVMGGIEPAKTYILEALKAGKT